MKTRTIDLLLVVATVSAVSIIAYSMIKKAKANSRPPLKGDGALSDIKNNIRVGLIEKGRKSLTPSQYALIMDIANDSEDEISKNMPEVTDAPNGNYSLVDRFVISVGRVFPGKYTVSDIKSVWAFLSNPLFKKQ